METPINKDIVERVLSGHGIREFGRATIREVVSIASQLERETGLEFVRMEMGVPGLKANEVGIKAEIESLKRGVASVYPVIDGLFELKHESSRFIKAFMDTELSAAGCVPVTGSMQGTYASFLTCCQCVADRDTILFIDPGFPVQKQQLTVMGYRYESFDVYDYRGERLRTKLESYLASGRIAALIYSNPNNPTWLCLTDSELRIIGELSMRYDVIVIEDLAYFAMDFRMSLGSPFESPYQPTVSRYTDNYIMQLSGSKIFSYAGERIGISAISDVLYGRHYAGLTSRYGVGATFGSAYIHRILYALSSGTGHAAQYALAAMFRAASDGELNFVNDVREYGNRASRLKEIFLRHGFHLVYACDLDRPIADGFYFTIGYDGLSGGELMERLLYYGISAISLTSTGSGREGIRACTSFIKPHQYAMLDDRLGRLVKDL
jgi:aspartate/methionine/tyrosine aminotransferase